MGDPQIIQDDNVKNFELAYAHDASAESVRLVLDAGADTEEGRSGWVWLRLRNGDLILGVFPRGATYEAVEVDAQFPGVPAALAPTTGEGIPERPTPIPEGWTVIDYRAPVEWEKYYTRYKTGNPLTARQQPGTYTDEGGYWIVVPTRPVPIPDGWRLIAYREPELGERYFNENAKNSPYRKRATGSTPGDKWIVVPA